MTESQFMATFGASALSQTASASASAPTSASASAAANYNDPPATSTPDAIEPAPAERAAVEDQPAEPAPLPEVQAANDKAPAAIIPVNDNAPPVEASTPLPATEPTSAAQ